MSKCNEKIPLWRVLLLFLICVLVHYLYLYSHVFEGAQTTSVYRVVESDVKAVLGDKYGSISYYLKVMKENPERTKQEIATKKDAKTSDLAPDKPNVSKDPGSGLRNVSEDTDNLMSKELLTGLLKDKILQNESVPLLTLFTTWNYSVNKTLLHNLTVRNWVLLRPFIIPVVFTNDSGIAEECSQYGWEILPIRVEAAGGVPVLKHMYRDIMAEYNTTFYAYSNSDILYTDTLIETLASLINSSLDLEKPMLIVGKRTNIKFLTEQEGSSWENLTAVSKTRGHLFAPNAEDYFITTRVYPWERIPELVIGRRAYDNWLVYQARKNKQAVVDVTKTVLAVHQTTEAGNLEGHTHKNKDYNVKLLRRLDRKIKYIAGYINCAETYTKYVQESIIVDSRTVDKRNCLIR